MAESTEHKKEPNPLTEEEVEALAEKFTASWEAADDGRHSDPDDLGPSASTGAPGVRTNSPPGSAELKRTMVGLAPAVRSAIPNQAEIPEQSPAADEDDEEGQCLRQPEI